MKRFFITSALLGLVGCQQTPHLTDNAEQRQSPKEGQETQVNAVRPALDFFSSYMSEAGSNQCLSKNSNSPCVEDAIPAEAFFNALKQSQRFVDVLPSSNQHDYQVLIANEAAQVARTSWQKFQGSVLGDQRYRADTTTYFTEISLQWRGLEIHSEMFELDVPTQTDPDNAKLASQVVEQWADSSESQGIFTPSYLFAALKASDYQRDLKIPANIGEFENTDTELYPDPFKGVISRYIHPIYENAVMDITVYPILQDINTPLPDLLNFEMQNELHQAQMVAEARQTPLVVDVPPSPFESAGNSGYRLALSATGTDGEPMFATSYVFKMEDKIVKFSGTFPPRIADDLVSRTLPLMNVPGESVLMAELRQIAHQ